MPAPLILMAVPPLQWDMSLPKNLYYLLTEGSPFIMKIVKGEEMREDERTITAETGPDSETSSKFSGFKPDDLNDISGPN